MDPLNPFNIIYHGQTTSPPTNAAYATLTHSHAGHSTVLAGQVGGGNGVGYLPLTQTNTGIIASIHTTANYMPLSQNYAVDCTTAAESLIRLEESNSVEYSNDMYDEQISLNSHQPPTQQPQPSVSPSTSSIPLQLEQNEDQAKSKTINAYFIEEHVSDEDSTVKTQAALKRQPEEVPENTRNTVCGICKCRFQSRTNIKDMFVDTTSLTHTVLAEFIAAILRRPYRDIEFYSRKLICSTCFYLIERVDDLHIRYNIIREELFDIKEKIRSQMNVPLPKIKPKSKKRRKKRQKTNKSKNSTTEEIDSDLTVSEDELFDGTVKNLKEESFDAGNEDESVKEDPENESNDRSTGLKETTFQEVTFAFPVKKLFPCKICGKHAKTRTELKQHFDDAHAKDCIIECQLCLKVFSGGFETFGSHVKSDHPTLNPLQVMAIFTVSEQKLFRRKLWRPERANCPYCNKYFSGHNIKRHINDSHEHKYIHKCTKCSEMFKNYSDLQSHRRKIHKMQVQLRGAGVSKYPCEVCGKKFMCDAFLQKHLTLTHISKSTNDPACDFCAIEFPTFDDLKAHRQMHQVSGQTSYLCSFCGKSYTTFSALKIHKQVHEEEEGQHPNYQSFKSFSCEVCGKKFQQKALLTKHVNSTHFSESKVPTCEYCTKEFANLNELKDHLQLHISIGEMKCPCIICGKSFKSVRALKVHKRNHKPQEQYFGCKLCGRNDFNRVLDVTFHIKKLHVGYEVKDLLTGPFKIR